MCVPASPHPHFYDYKVCVFLYTVLPAPLLLPLLAPGKRVHLPARIPNITSSGCESVQVPTYLHPPRCDCWVRVNVY